MGVALRQAGIMTLIVDKAGDLGGTWRDNPTPACAATCLPPLLLLFRSWQWSRRFRRQEILAYM